MSSGAVFQALVVDMTSIDHDDKESDELITLHEESWAKHIDTFWNVQFEQQDPPTEDKVIQINMGAKENQKLIFIRESLTPAEKGDHVALIIEYIDVFA